MNIETKVGAFVLSGLFLIGTSIFMLGDFSLQKEYPVYVEFEDVVGLPNKSIVKLSGVEVGKVKDIEIEGDHVIVELAIKDKVKIYRNAKFQIGSTSIIGSKFLQIDQGTPGSGTFKDGDRVLGNNTLPLDRMLAATLSSIQEMIDDINKKGKLGDRINSITSNLDSTLKNLRELTLNLNDMVAEMSPHMRSSMENIDSVTEKLDTLLVKADKVMQDISEGNGAVGALVSDPEMKKEVKETVTNLKEATASAKKVLGRVNDFRVFWLYENRYEPIARRSRSDIGVKISPREGRYYYLGLSNIGNPDDEPRGPDYEKENTIDARLGWETEKAEVYAGFIKSAGGFGIKYRPFAGVPALESFSALVEASDFLRNREIKGRKFTHPRYDVGAEIKLHRIFSITGRVADIQETAVTQYGARITLEDKDIAYLLGLVTLGTTRASGGK
jgi:phospholipid/cholesterol/gamma-HCH transport system substrate-binding protein